MKAFASILAISLFILIAARASAQEAVPLEEAKDAATKINAALSWREKPVIEVSPDLEKPFALKGGKGGGMVVPDIKLTADAIENAGETPVPVGQFWMLGVELAPDGAPTKRDMAKYVSVGEGDKAREVRLYLLGVRKSAPDKLELVIYGTGKEPVATLPLEAASAASDLPLKLSSEKVSDTQAKVTIGILGRYRASVTVRKEAD